MAEFDASPWKGGTAYSDLTVLAAEHERAMA